MPRLIGLLTASVLCLAVAALFFAWAVLGSYFEQPTRPTDLGLYAVTVTLLAFGGGGLLLRWGKLSQSPSE